MSTAQRAVKAMTSETRPAPKQTSIRAHIVESVAITMSRSELDVLSRMVSNIDQYSLDSLQIQVRAEFIDAIESTL